MSLPAEAKHPPRPRAIEVNAFHIGTSRGTPRALPMSGYPSVQEDRVVEEGTSLPLIEGGVGVGVNEQKSTTETPLCVSTEGT